MPKKSAACSRDYLPFAGLFLLSAVFLLYCYPSLYLSGEMWAESGNNFFLNAKLSSFWENLKTVDYVYLPLLPRILALIVEAFSISTVNAPYVYQAFALCGISYCIAFFSLPYFRRIIHSDIVRALICLGLIFHRDYHLKAFINFAYYGAIVYFLLLLALPTMQLNRWGKTIGLGLLFGFFTCSKPFFLGFLPALGLLFLFFAQQKKWQHCAAVVIPIVCGLMQMVVVWFLAPSPVGAEHFDKSITVLDFVRVVFQEFNGTFNYAFLGKIFIESGIKKHFWLVGLCISALGILCYQNLRIKECLSIFLLGLIVTFSTFIFTIASYLKLAHERLHLPFEVHNLEHRQYFIQTVVMYLTVAIILAKTLEKTRYGIFTLALWLFATHPFGIHKRAKDAQWPTAGFGSWKEFAPSVFDTKNGQGCVPINPYPWIAAVNCQILRNPPPPEAFRTIFMPLKQTDYAIGTEKNWEIDFFGVALKNNSSSKNLVAIAYDAEHHEIARAQPSENRNQVLTYFRFTPAIRNAHSIRFSEGNSVSIAVDNQEKPVWIWFGRLL